MREREIEREQWVLCWNGVGRWWKQCDHQFYYENFNESVLVYILVVKSNEKGIKSGLYIVCWVKCISVCVHGITFIMNSKNILQEPGHIQVTC